MTTARRFAVQPPGSDIPSCPRCYPWFGAVEGRLVAVGQGRGSLAALDPDVIARPRRARDFSAAVPPQCVEDDLLDICPGDARGVELAAGWVDAERDACVVGTEREPAASNQNDVRQHGGSADHNNDQRMEPDDADDTENDVDDRGAQRPCGITNPSNAGIVPVKSWWWR